MWPGLRPTCLPSGILIHPAVEATIDMGRKLGAPLRFGGGELGPHLTQCRLSREYLLTKWHLDPSSHLDTTDMCGKLAGALPHFRGGELSTHLTQCRLG